MKKFTTLAVLLLLCVVGLFAQAPDKFTYQAVVRFANNSLAANTQIGVRISILQGSVVGEAVFVETHIVNSNANGLITLEIGSGNVQVGSISNIDWSNGLYFLRTETDPYGGIDYIVTSTQQLMSVPYALYAKEAGNGFSGDYNDLTNTPVIPIVPSDVSAFNNDAGYLTSFTEQQVLSISNDTVFLTGGSFVKLPAGFDGDYNSLINKPVIPTTVGELTNNANYITIEEVPAQVNADWNATEGAAQILNKPELFDGDYNSLTNKPELFSGDYNDLTNTPTIPTVPTNVGAFTNDANYVTTTQLNDANYITAADVPAQVNADWNATEGAAQILNKPTNVSAFTNDAGYITAANVQEAANIPTNVSAFNNDAGYITSEDIPEIPTVPTNVSAFNNDAGYLTEYTEQQVLSISNDTLFLTGGSYVKLPAGFDGDYNSLTNKPTIPTVPTNVSAFTNDAGYITGTDIPAIPTVPTNVSAFTNDAGYLTEYTEQQVLSISNDTLFLTGGSYVKLPAGFDGDYNSLTNKPVIPTTVGELTNDANYITIEQVPAQVNADWNATEGVAQILNKPTNVSAFTNDAGYITAANVQEAANIPTNVSAFNNDAGYITSEDIPEIPTVPTNVSAFTNDAGYLTEYTEQQVLSISNDTLFLTGGSYVKMPAGFDGDYNSLTNKPTIPTVPTNVSAFTNDAGYITAANVQEAANIPTNVSAFNNDAGYITSEDIPEIPTVPTNVSAFNNDAGYLTEYTEQQVLSISNDTLFLTGGSFVKLPAGFDGDYNSLINKPVIPTTVAELTNNANYITIEEVPAQVNADWNATEGAAQILNKPELFDGDYNSLTNTPSIPTTVSELTNDANYITINDVPEIPTVPTNVSAFNNDAGYITNADIPEIPTVPTSVSVFTNDANYISNTGSCINSVNLCDMLERLEMLENQLQPIMIMTEGVTAITQTSFTVMGKVLADSSNAITQRGFVYGIDHNPTLDNNSVSNGNGNGSFTSTINGLNAAHTYYVRAFAINNNGTFYGNEMAVTTMAPSPSTLPSVTTIAVTNITVNEATVRGEVTSDGGETVTHRGFVYDTLPNPTIDNLVAYHGTGVGQYVNLLTYLYPGKTYYFRAFAQNSVGVAYGNELTFTTNVPSPVAGDAIPCPGTPTVTDHEGNIYNTVQIGTQCWTKENLRTTTSPSTGTYLIPPAGTASTYTGKQAWWYDNDSATYAPRNCGLLYNYNAAMDTFNTAFGETSLSSVYEEGINYDFSEPRRGICPQGWHVPSHAEWVQLYDYLNSHEEYRSGNVSGNVTKALASTNYWAEHEQTYSPGNIPSENNLSGFSAIPAGCSGISHHTTAYGLNASFWSTTPWWDLRMWHFTLIYYDVDVWQDGAYKNGGLSVRCLKD